MRDLVILLPGIAGSVLQKDGKDLWGLSLRAIFSAVSSAAKNLRGMKLEGDDPAIDDLGDGISATRLINDARVIPGLIKVDGYNRVSEMIKGSFDVVQGTCDLCVKPYPPANYFEFAYDWRRDNRVSARRLAALIGDRIMQWREFAGDDCQVILLAHSMGGIVARYYLEVLDGWKDCKALITFGTPFRGSVKALDYLVNGCSKGPLDLTDIVRSFTSVYQLLPIYKVVQVDGVCRKVTDVEIPGLNEGAARKALAFHQQMIDLVNRRKQLGGSTQYVLTPVVGQYQPTLQSAEMYENELSVSETLPAGVDKLLGHGDGTVPYLSAIPPEESGAHHNLFCPESHGSLHCNNQVLDYIYDQLSDLQIQGLEDLRGARVLARQRAAISLRIPELCMTTEPVLIRARVLMNGDQMTNVKQNKEIIGSLTASIERTDGGMVSEVVLRHDGTEWIATAKDLSAGIYRVGVQATRRGSLSPFPVHDLFQVAAM